MIRKVPPINLLSRSKFCEMVQKRWFNQEFLSKYSAEKQQKIIQVINSSSDEDLSRYDLTKPKLKKFIQYKTSNGEIKNLSDIEQIDGFSERIAKKLFDSILEGPMSGQKLSNKIKGQILQPILSESVRESCKTVLSVFVAVNSISWTLIDRSNYEVLEWEYHGIHHPEAKKLQIADILDIIWHIFHKLPPADICVMKAEATTLRAAGSDPNNPKVIAVNLQKAQMVAMLVALINSRGNSQVSLDEETKDEAKLDHKVYFLRPTLPYRLYGTLVGNEKVATDQTVETILQNATLASNNSHVHIKQPLQGMFRSKMDLQKDMLGHCLLLGLTFMDICVYRNKDRVAKLMKQRE